MPYTSNIWKMYLFKFLLSLHFVGGVLVPFFLEWGKISFTQLMLLQSFFVFSVFLLEVPTGAFADRFGRKTSLVSGAIFVAAGVLVYSWRPSIYVFFVAEFLWAAGVAFFSGADEALIYDSLKQIKREKVSKKVFGMFGSFGLLGLMVAAPIGSFIASVFGLRYTMLLVAVPATFAFLVGLSLKEPELKYRVKPRGYMKTLFNGMRYVKNHGVLRILAFDRISIAVLAFFIIWTYQPLLGQLGVPILYFGWVAAGISGAQMFLMNSSMFFEKVFGSKKNYLLWGALISGGAFVFLGLNNNILLAVVLIILAAGFGLSREILFQNYMNKYIESHNRATVVSTVSMLDKLAMGLLYPVVGLLVEWSLNYTFTIIGAVMVICALLSRVKEEHLID